MSIISPIYRGEKMLNELVSRIEKSVETFTQDYEIILVNDSSPDNSWQIIKTICEKDKKVKGVNLSRNFGQHYAISAGLSISNGEWNIVMDCDLQDIPEEIPNLYNKALEGYDIVYARRIQRQDGFFKKISSRLFHKVFDWLSGTKSDSSIANFGIYHSKVIKEYNKMCEVARSFGSLISYLGFKVTAINIKHSTRAEGKSSYTLSKLIRLSLDIIISNTNKPLRMAVGFGFFMSFIAFVLAIYNIIAKLTGIIIVEGYTTTVFSIWFVGGMLLMMLGIVGLYIDKIFNQVKGRPIYVISEKLNC
ncbi:MAG: glycosyltransferase family 2 protein [Bacteroidales bacterium]|nr:glycosyltransferase family 2 protein [Bacteroidales bacterium]